MKRRTAKRPTRRQNKNLEHLRSAIQLSLTLKSQHKQQEIYPINLANLIGRANVGPDAEVKLIGYTMRIQIATGNNCSTVSASIGHSGPWVRPAASSDNFNQQFTDMSFNLNKEVTFHKRLLRESERQYLNPDNGQNFLNLRIRDPCGVIPGATILIHFSCELIRSVIDVEFLNADKMASDLYEDQDVHTSSQPTPKQDVPLIVRRVQSRGNDIFRANGIVSPIVYSLNGTTYKYTVTVAGIPNLIGEFADDQQSSAPIQDRYTADGFAGNITAA